MTMPGKLHDQHSPGSSLTRRTFPRAGWSASAGRCFVMPRTTNTRAAQVQIDRMVKRIVKKFAPKRIILFGSQARGDAGPDSDIDLLIIMPVKGWKET